MKKEISIIIRIYSFQKMNKYFFLSNKINFKYKSGKKMEISSNKHKLSSFVMNVIIYNIPEKFKSHLLI